MKGVLLSSQRICLPKATARPVTPLKRLDPCVSENQPICSYRFEKHLKQCRAQNSERSLRTPVDKKEEKKEKRRVEKDRNHREGANKVSVGRLQKIPSGSS